MENTKNENRYDIIISRIQERIKNREKDIEMFYKIISESGNMINRIELNVKLIKEAEIRISELNAVLYNCL